MCCIYSVVLMLTVMLSCGLQQNVLESRVLSSVGQKQPPAWFICSVGTNIPLLKRSWHLYTQYLEGGFSHFPLPLQKHREEP